MRGSLWMLVVGKAQVGGLAINGGRRNLEDTKKIFGADDDDDDDDELFLWYG